MNVKNEIIQNLYREINKLQLNPLEVNEVFSESSPEESTIVGTEDSLLALARLIVTLVYESRNNLDSTVDAYSSNFLGKNTVVTNEIKKIFIEFSDVWPIGLALVERVIDENL